MENLNYWAQYVNAQTDSYKKNQAKNHLYQAESDYLTKRKMCGAFSDMSNGNYHGSVGYSASRLKKGLKSTFDFFQLEEQQDKQEYFDYGNLAELMLLEPDRYNEMLSKGEIVIYNENNRPEPSKSFASKLNKEWKANIFNSAKIVVNESDYQEIKQAVEDCKNNDQFQKLADGMQPQQSYFWIDEESELLLKTRPDIVKEVGNDGLFVTDVKTCRDGSPRGFAKDCANLHYPLQAVTQIDGIEATTGKKVLIYTYLIIEKGTGLVQFYQLSKEDIHLYRKVYKKMLLRIRKTLNNPSRLKLGYNELFEQNKASILPLELPYYAKKELMENFNID